MRIPEIGSQTCSVARAVSVVGDPWTLLVLRELFLGSRRFDELAAQTGMSPRLLSARMRSLAAAGIVERRLYQARPPRHDYRLTRKGTDLWPLMMALRAWGDRWEDWPKGRPTRLRHAACGRLAEPRIVCSECAAPMKPGETRIEPSPAALAERKARSGRGAGAEIRRSKSRRARA